VAHNRPPLDSTIERLIAKRMPVHAKILSDAI